MLISQVYVSGHVKACVGELAALVVVFQYVSRCVEALRVWVCEACIQAAVVAIPGCDIAISFKIVCYQLCLARNREL